MLPLYDFGNLSQSDVPLKAGLSSPNSGDFITKVKQINSQ